MILDKQQARNIETLARYLERHVPRKLFNMDTFKESRSCGTVGCALGWAVHVPTLRKHGLGEIHDLENFRPTIGGKEAGVEDVADVFFGQGSYAGLFSSFTPVATPKQWARHARNWLKEQTIV